jgi:hypothetical protein
MRSLDLYGDANHWEVQPRGTIATPMDFMNTTKYPPSKSRRNDFWLSYL